MRKHEMMPDFKRKFESSTGVKLDYRTMAYLQNKDCNYPIYSKELATEVVLCLEQYLNNYIEANRSQYPDFDGFVFKPGAEIKKLKQMTLKSYIEGYITETFQRKVTAKKHKPVLNRCDALIPNNITLNGEDEKKAVAIGRGNKSLGVRLALREYTL